MENALRVQAEVGRIYFRHGKAQEKADSVQHNNISHQILDGVSAKFSFKFI